MAETVGTSAATLVLTALGGLILARVLGPVGRGELAALLLWATLAMDIAMVGSAGSLTYHVAAQPKSRGEITSMMARAALPMAFAGILVFVGFAVWSGRIQSLNSATLLLFALYVPLRIIAELLQALLQGDGRFRLFNLVRLTVVAVPVLGFAVLAFWGRLSVETVAIFYVATMILVGTMALRAAAPVRLRSRATRALRVHFWSYSFRNWLSLLSAKGNRTIDLLYLTLVALPAVVGEYAVATSVAGVTAFVGGAVGMVAFPRLAETANPEARSSTLRRFFVLALAGSLAVGVLLAILAGWLVPTFYGQEFVGSVSTARILIVGYFAVSLSTFTGNALRGLDHPGVVAVSQLMGFLTTVLVIVVSGAGGASVVAVAAAAGFWTTLVIEIGVLGTILRSGTSSTRSGASM